MAKYKPKKDKSKGAGGRTIGAKGGGKEPELYPELQSNWMQTKPLVYLSMMI